MCIIRRVVADEALSASNVGGSVTYEGGVVHEVGAFEDELPRQAEQRRAVPHALGLRACRGDHLGEGVDAPELHGFGGRGDGHSAVTSVGDANLQKCYGGLCGIVLPRTLHTQDRQAWACM